MSAHNDETLPVLSALAKEFLVFDKWHASVPGMMRMGWVRIASHWLDGSDSFGIGVQVAMQVGCI